MGKQDNLSKKGRIIQTQVIVLILVLVILGICAAVFLPRITGTPRSPSLAKNQQVSVEDAYQLYLDDAYVLDVRTAQEWQTGHIPGATLIPLDELAARSSELPVGEPILIYCRSGNLSLEAMNMLGSVGYMNLSSMRGGIKDWIVAGYPLE